MISIKDRIAIVTGASSGIGWGIAKAIATEGAITVLAARSADKLEKLAAEIEAEDGHAFVVPTDVTDDAQVERLFATVKEKYGRLDILINNAGIADHTPVEKLTNERWHEVIGANLHSVFYCSRAAFVIMQEQKRGRIINMGSLSSKVPRGHTAAYTASKFALEGLTRSLAVDGREHGIAVSMVHPGSTVSSLVPGVTDKVRPATMMPMDVARIVVLMATLPDDVNLYESIILPVEMPFLGRG
ncbi:SDR family oxidoreductase [Neorhizobium galegae]|uniref:SDR family oxidoreductase n=1 Tax=Neorhizobium galegae TaxID=399 RepID=UPI0006216811|nr:SDR family oxidoreductase [Neorhizobium galegae]CDZ26703.1 Short-chain dehydrogenase/reductase SDR [Neorhizobium galegae bv. officinalis]KAA9383667.1 SDR family oxidoreductase [Neorhizobium galegae]KAB1111795.1 SDR family oxidoreductase [Neorhizobium galegae]MCM2500874.1 SDR family oxidoreductase [Neorhizobium galegae]MCQ1768304.1 SDR family oxidoreductase [Neorhizobium galegae]